MEHNGENHVSIEQTRDELRAGKKDRFSVCWTTEDCRIHLLHSMQLQGCLVQIKLLQIVNREGSNFVLFLNRTVVLMDQSESVAQPTPGTSSGTDSATIPPVLTEQDIPGAALNAVN